MNLVAHPIGNEDYQVLDDGHRVGRIRKAIERMPAVWIWNVQILMPIPAWCNGSAPSREAAMAQFRQAWTRFKADIDPQRYAEALAEAAAARAGFT